MTEGKIDRGRSVAGSTVDEKDALVEQIVEREARLQRGFLAQRTNPLLDLDLTMQQLKALLLLSFHGSASGHELAEVLGVHLATATGIVDRLVRRGLAQRGEDPNDRRIRRVFVTDEGSTLAEGVWSAGLDERRKLLKELDADNLRKLKEVLEALTVAACERMKDESGSTEPGPETTRTRGTQ